MAFIFAFGAARLGFDLSVPADADTWACLHEEAKGAFGIVRVYRNIGQVDKNATNSILSSLGTFATLDGYMFPCVANSPYALNNSIACDTPDVQVKRTLDFLAEDGIGVEGSSLQPTPYFPLRATLGKIWIDIEDEVPSKYFSPRIQDNVDLLQSMVGALEGYGISVGIYTTSTYWKNIMGNVEGYGKHSLWYPRYDDINSMDFFEPFADFDNVQIKQTQGNVALCGLTQVDSNYESMV